MGGATILKISFFVFHVFQSTLPVGGATATKQVNYFPHGNFNPRSPWGERRRLECKVCDPIPISIHAPRGGSDCMKNVLAAIGSDFNPRSPWGERLVCCNQAIPVYTFQSTLPVGGATFCQVCLSEWTTISIHAPRGGSDDPEYVWIEAILDFNPRSPWGERQYRQGRREQSKRFQSTLPVGGATRGR